jgi:ribonuclease HI
VRELVATARRQGIRIRAYLHDWLIVASERQQCHLHTVTVLDLASKLGFVVNAEKSDLTPAQRFRYLGMEIDTVQWLVRPSDDRVQRLLGSLRDLRSASSASARSLASLLGHCESLVPLVPLAGVFKRPLQRGLQDRWSQASSSWVAQVPLGAWFLEATERWMDASWLSQGVPVVLPASAAEVFTDASLAGWGAHCGQHTAHGLWSAEQASWHINLLELKAVVLALKAFLLVLPKGVITIRSDNATVVAYINRQGGTRSRALSIQAERLLVWANSQEWSLVAVHVQGAANVLADALSRSHTVVATEWTIANRVLDRVWRRYFKPMVDLFATRFNHRLPVYVSPVPDPQAWAVDALAISWEGLEAYAFPPLPLLERVLRKAELEKPRLLLIAPFWPRQTWFADLVRLARGEPFPLDLGPRELLQPRSGIAHGNPDALHLHAWRL